MEAFKTYIWILVAAAFALLWVYGLLTMNSTQGPKACEAPGAAGQGDDAFQSAEDEEHYLARMRAQEFSTGETSTQPESEMLRDEVDLNSRW